MCACVISFFNQFASTFVSYRSLLMPKMRINCLSQLFVLCVVRESINLSSFGREKNWCVCIKSAQHSYHRRKSKLWKYKKKSRNKSAMIECTVCAWIVLWCDEMLASVSITAKVENLMHSLRLQCNSVALDPICALQNIRRNECNVENCANVLCFVT